MCFKIKVKLVTRYHVIKTMVSDYDFKFFKLVKIIVTNYSFKLKVKIIVGHYGFNQLIFFQNRSH